MGRQPGRKNAPFTISLSKELMEEVRAEADRERRTVASLADEAFTDLVRKLRERREKIGR